MARQRIAVSIFDINLRARPAVLVALAIFVATLTIVPAANAQTLTVLHSFTGGQDGSGPYTGLTMDRAGNLYGTTSYGGYAGNNDCKDLGGCGVVFKLARAGSGWIFTPLYEFLGVFNHGDGSIPYSPVIVGSNGALYGTTTHGGLGDGCNDGCGTVFKLTPPASFCKGFACYWNETQIHLFNSTDGAFPTGWLAFDSAGNLYGGAGGIIYELVASNGWQENLLYNLGNDGAPTGGVTMDPAGNLYGTTFSGGSGDEGIVFQLAKTQSGWTLNTLYSFNEFTLGFGNYAGVILDSAGNLYGATVNGNPDGDAYVYELSPSGSGWNYTTLYIFPQSLGGGPAANLALDAAGNLYGTTRGGGGTNNPWGNVFKLTPSNGGWVYTDLHDFTGGSDGGVPYSSVVIDSNGNLYGTASAGGAHGDGTVWEITP